MCERRVVFFSFSSVSIQDKCVFVTKKSPFFGSKSYLSLLFGVNWALVWAKNPNKWFHNPMSISVLSLMQEDKNKIRPYSAKAIFTIVSPKLLNNIAYLCHCYGRFFLSVYERKKQYKTHVVVGRLWVISVNMIGYLVWFSVVNLSHFRIYLIHITCQSKCCSFFGCVCAWVSHKGEPDQSK